MLPNRHSDPVFYWQCVQVDSDPRVHRRRQHRYGRECLQLALAEIGGGPVSKSWQSLGPPKMPSGFSGSVSHSGQLVIARAAVEPSVGIDCEMYFGKKRVEQAFKYMFNSVERGWVLRDTKCPLDSLATLVFSAKESVYKAHFKEFGNIGLNIQGGITVSDFVDSGFIYKVTCNGREKSGCGWWIANFLDEFVVTGI